MNENESGSSELPPSPPPVANRAATSGDLPSAEERQWALFAHLSALLGMLVCGIGAIVGPLVIWLIKKDTMAFVDDQGKEALNFNITVAIAAVTLIVGSIITFGLGLLIAIPLGLAIWVAWLVLTIVAAVKANEGVRYRYPICLRLIN